MPLYLTRFNYMPATSATLVQNPEDHRAAATHRPLTYVSRGATK